MIAPLQDETLPNEPGRDPHERLGETLDQEQQPPQVVLDELERQRSGFGTADTH